MESLDFDLDDVEFDFDFEIKSSAEEFLNNIPESEDEEDDPDVDLWNAMKTRVSTDPVIELVSRDKEVIKMLEDYHFEDAAPMMENARPIEDINFQKIYNEFGEKQGDLKVDVYFAGSDLQEEKGKYSSEIRTQTRLVNDFLLTSRTIDVDLVDDRLRFLEFLLNRFVDNKDISVPQYKNSFMTERLNRKREKERELGSVELGTSGSVWRRYKLLLFKEHKSNFDKILLDSLNLDDNEAFRLIFAHNQRIIESILSNIENTFMLSYLKYISTLSKQILHTSVVKRKRNTFRVMTGGAANSITVVAQGDTVRNEKSSIKLFNAYIVSSEYSQIIKDMKGSMCKYKYYPVDEKRVLIISNWYTITPRLLTQYSESFGKTLSFGLYTALNGEPQSYKIRLRNSCFMSMMAGLSKNREVVNFLSLSRYVSASLMSKWSNIPNLIHEKLPKRNSSMFCDYVIHTYLTFLRKPLLNLEWNKDSMGKQFLNQDDFTFTCFLPYLQFETERIQDFLSDTYLVNLCCDDLVESNHSFLEFTETLKKFEDMRTTDPDYFYCKPDIIERISLSVMEHVILVGDIDISAAEVEKRRLLSYCTPNGVLSEGQRRAIKLYDRILEEIYRKKSEVTLMDMLKFHKFENFKFTMVEKKQKSDPREIFKTDLKGIAALKIIETYIDYINRGLFSETISMGGDQKYFRTQNETHKIISSNRESILSGNDDRFIFSRTSDASKWSTGDNMDSLISAYKPMSHYIDEDVFKLTLKSLENIKHRELVMENKMYTPGRRTAKKTIAQSAHLRNAINRVFDTDENPIIQSGWPQGFFNKLSTYKHFIAQTIAILFYKIRRYRMKGLVSGIIDQSCHSDDYTYIVDFEEEDDLRLWESCLYNAKRICSIRENEKKSSIGTYCREFLSFFVVMGSVFIPHSKYITGLDKDVPGTSYTDDIYASMARIRECYRIGVSEVWCQFAMQLANYRIQRLYSVGYRMSNYNPSINNYSKPCEYGGYFWAHPIFLLFFGVKANNFRIYNRYGVTDLLKIIPSNYRLKEEDTEEIDDLRSLEGFFLFPKFDLKYGSDVKKIITDLRIEKTKTKFKYHERILSKYLNYDRAKELLANRLFEKAGRRMYAKIPKGMMEVVIHRTSNSVCFESELDKKFTIMELYQYIDNTPVVETADGKALIEMALFSTSNILATLQELYNSEIDIKDEVVQANRNISYMAHINLKNPGNLEVKNINESLALLCPVLSEEIKDNILKFKGDEILDDKFRMKSILDNSFGKESVDSLEELDLMIRFFNTKYPTNKFLMVPDVRLKSGIDNIDLFLKDMLSFRVAPFMYREFDWKPIGRVKDWKDSYIQSTNLLRTIRHSTAYEYLFNIINILICHYSTFTASFEESKKFVLDVIKESDYSNKLIHNLIRQHESEVIASGSRLSRVARALYVFSKIGIIVSNEYSKWYESQNFPIEYVFGADGSCFIREGSTLIEINKNKGIIIYLDLQRNTRSLLRPLWLAQMILRGERKNDVFYPYLHSLLGKGSLFVERKVRIEPTDLLITSEGFKSGYSGNLKWDIVQDVQVSNKIQPKLTGFCKINVLRFYSLLDYTVNKTYIETRDGIISINDVNGRLKIFDLEICNSSHIRYTGNIQYRGCSLSELISNNYFDRDNIIQVCNGLRMNVNRSFCGDIQGSLVIRQRLTREDLDSLDKIFFHLYNEYQPGVNIHDQVISKDLIIDKDDDETRFDDLKLIGFDEVNIETGMLSQRKTELTWQKMEQICTPRLKSKLYNHYIFGKTSWMGASSIYYECHSKLMSKAVREKDDKHASLLKLFTIMLTISKLNVVETRKSYDSNSNVIIKLLNTGGLGRKGKFWSDVFREVGISSDEEYI